MLGEAKAPWAARGSPWRHPAAQKAISSLGSESGTGFLGLSGVGRKQAGLATTYGLLLESHASSRLPPHLTSDAFTPTVGKQMKSRVCR